MKMNMEKKCADTLIAHAIAILAKTAHLAPCFDGVPSEFD